jgi:hypothetical protein
MLQLHATFSIFFWLFNYIIYSFEIVVNETRRLPVKSSEPVRLILAASCKKQIAHIQTKELFHFYSVISIHLLYALKSY